MAIEDLDETRHMGAAAIMGQIHIEAYIAYRLLRMPVAIQYCQRMANILYADLIDGQAPCIMATLHIDDGN